MKGSKRIFALLLAFVMLLAASSLLTNAATSDFSSRESTSSADYDTVFNGNVYANIGDYVSYAYKITTDKEIVNAQLSILYSSDTLELTEQSDDERFPLLAANADVLSYKNELTDTSGSFNLAFTSAENPVAGFENGACLVYLVFKVTAVGEASASADVVYIGGKNENISLDEIDIVSKNVVGEDAAVEEISEALESSGGDNLILGDVNGNGKVQSTDATLVLQYYAHIIEANTPGYCHSVSDVNSDGKTDNVDATLILQYYAKVIDSFT